jgi:hypothetical protein
MHIGHAYFSDIDKGQLYYRLRLSESVSRTVSKALTGREYGLVSSGATFTQWTPIDIRLYWSIFISIEEVHIYLIWGIDSRDFLDEDQIIN